MRICSLILSAAILSGCAPKIALPTATPHAHDPHHGHGESADVSPHKPELASLEVTTVGGVIAGKPTQLTLRIPDDQGKPIREFIPNHEALVHLIIVRAGLDQFAHLHPKVDTTTGTMTVTHTFPVGGTYHLFADYQVRGQPVKTATTPLKVTGDSPKPAELTVNAPGTITADGLTAKISLENVTVGPHGTIGFDLTDAMGKPITDLQPYLGAMGHLVIIGADVRRYVHAHPDAASMPSTVRFSATFAEAGMYKGWGQFQRAGQVKVVPFVVQVK